MDESMAKRWGYDRISVLRAIERQNDELGVLARMPNGEMVEEADRCIADGLSEWRREGTQQGRALTQAGRAILAESRRQVTAAPTEATDGAR